MQGLTSIKQEEANQKLLYSITPTDLQRVFTRYFAQFLNPNLRMTTLTTVSGDSAEAYRQSFNQTPKSEEFPLMGGNLADLDIPRYKLNLKIVTLNELELDV